MNASNKTWKNYKSSKRTWKKYTYRKPQEEGIKLNVAGIKISINQLKIKI
nr:MAG TPA: hypothetical protein [Caudoviricetes sp.]